ncbi:hypothetical protein LTR37_015357 [Vermiconidia calcicola]|uniref:Uncharacterized protein n=1 Tax=Vermiconidia calcicola TaxID=1690605 RepID=A0ACC3MRP7_9PEZI|nr:hypothetical protein LTR37_015357 [Vermiconidia calcicola]
MPANGAAAAAPPTPSSGTHPSRFFADAANVGDKLYHSLPKNIWFQRCLFMIQTFAIPLAYYFRPLCTAFALFWLVYRASQVLDKPLDELSALLGFDIPSTPLIDLAGVKADGAILHWSLPEKPRQKSSLKYAIHLNGVVIGTVPVQESAVTITGLQSASFYVARVALSNNNEFSSKSPPIRFRTKPASSGDYFVTTHDGHETDPDGAQELLPRVRPFRGLKDITPASPMSAPMAREGSSGLTPKRNVAGRRPSPAVLGLDNKHDPQPEDGEPPEGAETIQQLTDKLNAIRRETDEAEKQAKEEEEEELRQKEELTRERDELKAEVNEKEKASRNLKREVNTLERQNTAAQNERAKQERLLQQKVQDRQKLKDDMVRWEREAEEMKAVVERIRQDKEKHLEQAAQEKETLRARHTKETTNLRALDDEVKEKTSEIKKLERALKNNSPNSSDPEPNLVQQLQIDAEEERNWQMHKHALQQQYAVAFSKIEDAKRFHNEQLRYLESLRAERRRQEEMQQYASPPPTQERPIRRGDSQRSRHAPSRHSASDSPRLATFPSAQSPFPSHINPGPSAFNSAPFLNIQNGMTLQNPTDHVGMSEEDKEKMTGGAMMSPGAGAELLPADLFSGDGDHRMKPEHVQPLPGLGSLPGLPGLPGPSPSSTMQQDHPGPGPASPASARSRSPSVFASPQASQHNLHIGSPENVIDADRRSIRSTRSNRATSGGTSSRFSGMFGIKQRNKAMSDEGPPLGKANSMPRQDQGLPGLDAATRKRNSSISGTVFGGPIEPGNLDGASEAQPTAAVAPGRRAFGLFSREKSGGWPSSFAQFGRRPKSPRPRSTHSNELPRPSFDSSRWGVDAWPSGDATGGARNSPLAFGQGWNVPPSSSSSQQQPRMYGSRHPSRRPSVQYGASGPPEDIMEDDDDPDALDPDERPNLAPIGTKPPPGSTSSKKAETAAAKLNPNAKDFKSFFSSMKFGGKDKSTKEGSTDRNDGATPVPSASGTPNLTLSGAEEEESPPQSRKSRDTRSVTGSSLAESGRNSNELMRTTSYSNSDALAPSPSLTGSSKETFMQKISRKSSSGKFALPNFKREKSRLDAMTPGDDDEQDEMSLSVGDLKEQREPRESKEGNRSSRSWSSVLKLGGKKKGGETPSLSGISLATDETAEDGEEDTDEEDGRPQQQQVGHS